MNTHEKKIKAHFLMRSQRPKETEQMGVVHRYVS
jgi:hypothetical protein